LASLWRKCCCFLTCATIADCDDFEGLFARRTCRSPHVRDALLYLVGPSRYRQACPRGHWGVESKHCLLDVEFKDKLPRYDSGHRAKNMAIVRRFALGLVRANKSKRSVNTRIKSASWDTSYLLELLHLK
jgi:hypothetical protein